VLVVFEEGVKRREKVVKKNKINPTLAKKHNSPIRPDLRAKLRVVAGDVCQPDCGLGAADLEAVRTKSRFVIHCAASISFFDHVHTLLTQNYRATANVVTLAMRCAALAGYVHVSTAYVNINRPRGSHVEEKIYPLALPDGTPVRHADTAAELLGLPPKEATATANKLVAKLGYPNAYTLSKHLAEDLVAELHAAGRITACIVRPSIVGANAYGPSSGYFGNTAGPTSLTLAFASGMARFTCLNPDHVWDIIPCDIVAACVLGTAAALAAGAAPADEPLITHCASSVSNGERYGTLFNGVIFPYWAANPPKKRFTSGPYKPVDHWTAFLPATMFAFKWLNAWNTMKFKAIATLLKAHGRPDLAKQVWQGWKVYKLYNTPALDFDIFYCVSRAAAIEAALPEAERAAGAFQMVWAKGRDDWASYLTRHADVVRAKFFARYEKKPAGDAPPPPLPVAPAAPLGLSSALPPPPGCACADGLVMIPPCAVVSSAPEAAKGGVVIEEEGAAVAA
jgi:alcohol-forming fatty acyl-CoA reductase